MVGLLGNFLSSENEKILSIYHKRKKRNTNHWSCIVYSIEKYMIRDHMAGFKSHDFGWENALCWYSTSRYPSLFENVLASFKF